MNRRFTFKVAVMAVAAAFSVMTASAQETASKSKKADASRSVLVKGKQVSKVAKAAKDCYASAVQVKALSPKKKIWSDGTTEADILIDEDFSAFTAGTVNKPDTKLVASFYYQPGMYIDNALTKDGTWAGNYVYSAGGAVALLSPNEYTGSSLMTPLGDYSGDLTITFKVKALVDADMFVNILKGGYSACEDADVRNSDDTYDMRIYASQGWKEVTFKVSNYSADNDGFIQFQNYGSVVLDDIKVTTTTHFLASPKILPETDFTGNSFTTNWQPVRKARDYYVNLYKKVYTSDTDANYNVDFESVGEDGNGFPQDLTFAPVSDLKVKSDAGRDSSKGLILCNNDTLTLPYNFAKYKQLSIWFKMFDPDPWNNYNWYSSKLEIQALNLDGTWSSISYLTLANFLEGKPYDFKRYVSSEKYYGFRFIASDVPEGDYIVIDDINLTTGRPAKLEQVLDPDFSVDYPGYNTYYDQTSKTSYTFSNLDPYGDYYYTVRTHYRFDTSEALLTHAIGVASPATKAATDITAGESYTANWEESPRATSYEVTNYGVTKLDKDENNYALLDEDFSKIDADVTTATDPYNPEDLGSEGVTPLDGYTNVPGWTTTGTTVAQGMVGCAESYSGTNYVKTPEIYFGNGTTFRMHVKAYGVANEGLVMYVGGKMTGGYFQSTGEKMDGDEDNEKGVIDGTFEFSCPNKLDNITFYTLESTAFVLDEVKVMQDLKAGDCKYTYLGTQTVDGNARSCVFDDLASYGSFDDYAFNVKAEITDDGEYAESTKSDFRLISSASTSGISDVTKDSEIKEVARYSVDGKRISTPVRGINLVKLSNGKLLKVVVR